MKTVSVNQDVRIANALTIANTIFRSEPMTKQELVAKVGMSIPTVTVILNTLFEAGLIYHGSVQKNTGGRPANRILPNYDAACAIGVYLSPNHARFCLTNLDQAIIAKKKYSIKMENTPNYWQELYSCLQSFEEEFDVDSSKVLGIGFAFSSISSDLTEGQDDLLTVLSGNERIFLDVGHIRSVFSEYNSLVLSDAKVAAMAQRWSQPDLLDFVYLSINNNIGGAISINGEIVYPEKKNAEFGHMIIKSEGRRCVCGMNGCLDAYCSITSLESISGLSHAEFFERLAKGDKRVSKTWEEYLQNLTVTLSNLRVIFDMDIVIGGIMSQYLTNYQDELMDRFQRLHESHIVDSAVPFVRVSDLGEFSSSMGAGLVFTDAYLPTTINRLFTLEE